MKRRPFVQIERDTITAVSENDGMLSVYVRLKKAARFTPNKFDGNGRTILPNQLVLPDLAFHDRLYLNSNNPPSINMIKNHLNSLESVHAIKIEIFYHKGKKRRLITVFDTITTSVVDVESNVSSARSRSGVEREVGPSLEKGKNGKKEENEKRNVTSESRSQPPSDFVFPIKIKGGGNWTLPLSKLGEYVETFGSRQWVEDELRKARQWCTDNPSRRKTPGGMTAFLCRWLSKANDSGRCAGAEPDPVSYPPAVSIGDRRRKVAEESKRKENTNA